MEYWFEYNFPLNLLFDFSNVFFIVLILWLIFKYYYVPKNLKLILFASCFTPFLFNDFLFDWYLFPDQSKYLRAAYQCRTFNCDQPKFQLFFSGILFALSPILNIEGMKSLAFVNRFLLVLTILFFYLKKIDKVFILGLIFLPGIILYSSISIRDSFVLILSLLVFYSLFEKKYFFFFIVLVLLSLIKYQNAIFISLIIFFYLLYFQLGLKIKYKTLVSIFFIVFIYFILSDFLDLLNSRRLGFYHESYKDISNYQALTSFTFFMNLPIAFFDFIISPLKSISNLNSVIILIDTLILYVFSLILIIKNFKIDFNRSCYWLIILFGLISLHGTLVYDPGTIHRYKILIFIPVLFAQLYSIKKR